MRTLGDVQNPTMLGVARLGRRAFARGIREILRQVAGGTRDASEALWAEIEAR